MAPSAKSMSIALVFSKEIIFPKYVNFMFQLWELYENSPPEINISIFRARQTRRKERHEAITTARAAISDYPKAIAVDVEIKSSLVHRILAEIGKTASGLYSFSSGNGYVVYRRAPNNDRNIGQALA